MNIRFRDFFGLLWSRPGPVLAQAAMSGELLVAKIRLFLAVLLLLIPVLDTLFFPVGRKEGMVGLGLSCGTFLFAVAVYVLISRNFNPPWLPFLSSAYDVSQVSCALALFLVLNLPHTAVNSKVVFEGYFLAIGATALRYDQRVCISAGLLASVEYFAISYIAATHWDLNSPIYAPYPYGMFGWSNQIARIILMLTASTLSVALVSRSQKLLQMATADHLTGLFNRSYLEDCFAIELSRARRYGKALTLVVIDADRFKVLNDMHGHSAGDVVLKEIGTVLRGAFRQSDTVARYGGEEFVVLMPETEMDDAMQKAEAVRELLAATPIELNRRGEKVVVTISAGLATFPQDGNDEAELFAAADQRMYQAKKEGRNRVVASSEVVLMEV